MPHAMKVRAGEVVGGNGMPSAHPNRLMNPEGADLLQQVPSQQWPVLVVVQGPAFTGDEG